MRIVISFIVAMLFASCTTAEVITDGFNSKQYNKTIIHVNFTGVEIPSLKKANDYALWHSIEMAQKNGCNYFVTIDSQQFEQYNLRTKFTASESTTTLNLNILGGYFSVENNAYYDGDTYIIYYLSSSTAFVCFEKEPEGISRNVEVFIKSIKTQYAIE